MRLRLALVLLPLGACEPPPAATAPPARPVAVPALPDTSWRPVARERLGGVDHVRTLRSADGRFDLVVRQAPTTALQPVEITSYAVVDRQTGHVTASEEDVRGTVRWLDARTVEVTLTPGTVQGDPRRPIDAQPSAAPPRYRVDAATGRRR